MIFKPKRPKNIIAKHFLNHMIATLHPGVGTLTCWCYPFVLTFRIMHWIFQPLNDLKWKIFWLQIFRSHQSLQFSLGHVSIQDSLEISKSNNFKKMNIWDSKRFEIKTLSTIRCIGIEHYNFSIYHVNSRGGLRILNL